METEADKAEECCVENKQSATASSSSASEGNCGLAVQSPGICSPGPTSSLQSPRSGSQSAASSSPSHRRTTGPIRRAKGGWTPEEDEKLRHAVEHFKGKCWKKIAELFQGRSEVQCLHRWQKVLNPELVKGPWTQEEDDKIIKLVAKYGPKKWSIIAKSLPGRIGKQCRERWHNHLNPNIRKDAWTLEEELVLLQAHQVHGNKWAEIAKAIPGRTDNSIKNHWNSAMKKKLDFYLSSGKLPLLPKTSTQSCAKTVSEPGPNKFFSNKGLEATGESSKVNAMSLQADRKENFLKSEDGSNNWLRQLSTQVSDTIASCSNSADSSHFLQFGHIKDMRNLEGQNKWLEPSNRQIFYSDALVSTPTNRFNNPFGLECKPQVPKFDLRHNNSDLKLMSVGCDPLVTTNQANSIVVANIRSDISTYGSLCYKPPLENCYAPTDATLVSVYSPMQQRCKSKKLLSPLNFTPSMKDNCSSKQTPESILKSAAKTFPDTPSIFRKRKREHPISQSHEEKDAPKILDSSYNPEEKERTISNSPRHGSVNLSSGSPCYGIGGVSVYNSKAFDISPPYRLMSKRTAVYKSVEKQLKFTLDEDKLDKVKSLQLPIPTGDDANLSRKDGKK